MSYSDYIFENMERDLMKAISEYTPPQVRRVTIHTGPGGMDLFEGCLEEYNGTRRVYIGRKVSRIVRRVHKFIGKSHTGKYYYRIKIK